jgi:hypothetical protein
MADTSSPDSHVKDVKEVDADVAGDRDFEDAASRYTDSVKSGVEAEEVGDKLEHVDLKDDEEPRLSTSPTPISPANGSNHDATSSTIGTPKAQRRDSVQSLATSDRSGRSRTRTASLRSVDVEKTDMQHAGKGKGRDSVSSSLQGLDDGEREERPSSASSSRSVDLRMHSIDLSSTSPTTPLHPESRASSVWRSSLASESAPLSDVSLDDPPLPNDVAIFSPTSSLSTTAAAPSSQPRRPPTKTTSMATTSSAGHADFLLQRLEAQNALLSEDPKAKRSSLGGQEELRKGFEKLQSELEGSQEAENFIDWDFWGAVMSDYGYVATTRRG